MKVWKMYDHSFCRSLGHLNMSWLIILFDLLNLKPRNVEVNVLKLLKTFKCIQIRFHLMLQVFWYFATVSYELKLCGFKTIWYSAGKSLTKLLKNSIKEQLKHSHKVFLSLRAYEEVRKEPNPQSQLWPHQISSNFSFPFLISYQKKFHKIFDWAQSSHKRFQFSDPPLVNIQLGSTLSNDDIKEGDDLYLECHIQANPKVKKLSWLHNVSACQQFVKFIK